MPVQRINLNEFKTFLPMIFTLKIKDTPVGIRLSRMASLIILSIAIIIILRPMLSQKITTEL